MAIRILRRGHGFALADVYGIYYVAFAVHDFVAARTGAGIAAIQSHNNPSVLLICAPARFLYAEFYRVVRHVHSGAYANIRKYIYVHVRARGERRVDKGGSVGLTVRDKSLTSMGIKAFRVGGVKA